MSKRNAAWSVGVWLWVTVHAALVSVSWWNRVWLIVAMLCCYFGGQLFERGRLRSEETRDV